MKRIMVGLVSLVFLMVMTGVSFGARLAVPNLVPRDSNAKQASVRPEVINTLLNAVTTTSSTAGTAVDLGFTVGQIGWNISTGGTAPTYVDVYLMGSIDGTVYSAVDTATFTSSILTSTYGEGKTRFVTTKPVRYIKAAYTSRTGGDATTAVTIKALTIQ